MAVVTLSCTGATVTLDTDKDVIAIERDARYPTELPPVTNLKLSDITAVKHKFTGYSIPSRATGIIRFVYPDCPTGGDLLTSFATR